MTIEYLYGSQHVKPSKGTERVLKRNRPQCSWIVELEYSTVSVPRRLQLATIRLSPEVSEREAVKAAQLAVRAFHSMDIGKRKGKRPGIMEEDRADLLKIFKICEPAADKPGSLVLIIRIGQAIMEKLGCHMSQSTVKRDFLAWLRERGHHVRT
jgi:hypothetical protein